MNPTTIRDALTAIHPSAPWLALTVATFAGAYAIRRWAPRVWSVVFVWVPDAAPGLVRDAAQAFVVAAPATVLAAMASGMSVWGALAGLGAGIAAPLVHAFLKAAPGPYQGALGRAAKGLERGAISVDAAAVCAFVAWTSFAAWLTWAVR